MSASGCSFSSDSEFLAVTSFHRPYIILYKREGDIFIKLPNPSNLPSGDVYGCSFSPDGAYLAVAHNSSPYITIYKINGDDFEKVDNPSSLPTGIGYGCSFSPDGSYLAVGSFGRPPLLIYKRRGDTFIKLNDPTYLPSGAVLSCSFAPDGGHFAVGHVGSPYVSIYKRNGDTFTKLANLSNLPTSPTNGCTISPDGNCMVIVCDSPPFITIYEKNGDTFSKLAKPIDLPEGSGKSCSFSPDGRYLAVAHQGSPFLTIYMRDGDTFMKLNSLSDLPTGNSNGCSFSPNGNYLAVSHDAAPFITIYRLKYSQDKVLLTSYNESNIYSLIPSKNGVGTAIPRMTSNHSPSGRAFSSRIWGNAFDAWYAFNQMNDGQGSVSATDNGYLGYEFEEIIAIGKYSISSGTSTSSDALSAMPKDWTFEGSEDGEKWMILDSQNNQSWTTAVTEKEFNIINPTHYKFYRLNWRTNNGNSNYTNINELKMFEHFFSELISLNMVSEENFLTYGIENEDEIDITQPVQEVISVIQSSTILNAGKVYEHELGLSKRRVDHIIV